MGQYPFLAMHAGTKEFFTLTQIANVVNVGITGFYSSKKDTSSGARPDGSLDQESNVQPIELT